VLGVLFWTFRLGAFYISTSWGCVFPLEPLEFPRRGVGPSPLLCAARSAASVSASVHSTRSTDPGRDGTKGQADHHERTRHPDDPSAGTTDRGRKTRPGDCDRGWNPRLVRCTPRGPEDGTSPDRCEGADTAPRCPMATINTSRAAVFRDIVAPPAHMRHDRREDPLRDSVCHPRSTHCPLPPTATAAPINNPECSPAGSSFCRPRRLAVEKKRSMARLRAARGRHADSDEHGGTSRGARGGAISLSVRPPKLSRAKTASVAQTRRGVLRRDRPRPPRPPRVSRMRLSARPGSRAPIARSFSETHDRTARD